MTSTVVYEIEKSTGSKLSYSINWASDDGTNDGSDADTGWLQGETISTSTWTIPAGLTKISDTNNATTTKVVVDGGVEDAIYLCINTITTAAGLTESRILIIKMLPAQVAPAIGVTAYLTSVEADAILVQSSKWATATASQKSNALKWARVYFDDAYDTSLIDEADAPDRVKEANAILADEHLRKDLWTYQSEDYAISSKSVSAGGVSTSKSYDTSRRSRWIDPFPYVTALVSSECSIKKGNATSITYLMRG